MEFFRPINEKGQNIFELCLVTAVISLGLLTTFKFWIGYESKYKKEANVFSKQWKK